MTQDETISSEDAVRSQDNNFDRFGFPYHIASPNAFRYVNVDTFQMVLFYLIYVMPPIQYNISTRVLMVWF